MCDEHDLILLESQMQEIIDIVNKMQDDEGIDNWKENNKHTPTNILLKTCIWDLSGIRNEKYLIFDGEVWWNKEKTISGFTVTHYHV